MTDEWDVLLEVAIQHHVNKRNTVRTATLAESLDRTTQCVGHHLGELRGDGLVERVNTEAKAGHWRPWNWERY